MSTEATRFLMTDDTGIRLASAVEAVASALGGRGKHIYGFHIDGNVSDPSQAVTYLMDAVGMTPAHMDYANDVFDYGSWKDAFFMPKPCMVKYNGERDYYLDPDDYTKKEDGTASDVADTSYAGNAMMEWPKIWMKIVADSDSKSGSVYIADYKADSDFHCYSNINSRGVEVDHFYTAIYNGSNVSSKLRSISGQACANSLSGTTVITFATANNLGSDVLWYTDLYSDRVLINNLLILIGKSLSTQTVFGNGHYTGGSSASSLLTCGSMNAKGLFWGDDTTGVGVKVFGMENWWGNQWRRCAGHVLVDGVQKIKLTYGKQDGSTVDGYQTSDFSGYLTADSTAPSGTNGGYISKAKFTDKGIMPEVASGTASTYFCDGLWFNNSGTFYALVGGPCYYALKVGAFYVNLNNDVGNANWNIGACLFLSKVIYSMLTFLLAPWQKLTRCKHLSVACRTWMRG